MSLQVQTRTKNNSAILHCSGRIVAGTEVASLESEVRKCFAERLDVILDLSDVSHVDSSGLGLLVRLTCSARNMDLGLKLCSAPAMVQKLIKMTNLTSVLPTYDTAGEAIRDLGPQPLTRPVHESRASILCAHESLDVLACLRESLARHGYEVQTSSSPLDAVVLLKARNPQVVLGSPSMISKLRHPAAERGIALVPLDPDFASQNPAEAVPRVLLSIQATLAQQS